MTLDLNTVQKKAAEYTAAWNSGDPNAVANHFTETAQIVINRGEPSKGRTGIAEMAAGFHADVPDLVLTCDDIRLSGSHAIFVWTFTGHDAGTKNPLTIRGWEEWELSGDLEIQKSLGWFDAADYDRQVQGD